MIDSDKLTTIIEALLFASSQPMSARKIAALFEEHERPEVKQINDILEQLQQQYSERGIQLQQLATGWQFRVDNKLTPWVKRLWKTPTPRYSRALMETLALIAYRQPITRGEIENIRGISVNSNIIRTLEEHGWIREVGHKDAPGRPALLATSKQFLDHFGLKSLSELPPLQEIVSLDNIGADLEQALKDQQNGSNDNETSEANEQSAELAEEDQLATADADNNSKISTDDNDNSQDTASPSSTEESSELIEENLLATVDSTNSSEAFADDNDNNEITESIELTEQSSELAEEDQLPTTDVADNRELLADGSENDEVAESIESIDSTSEPAEEEDELSTSLLQETEQEG